MWYKNTFPQIGWA